ncbi:hypothetical protein GC197_08500 [bacterium]|nr:hypothetical protein [bacterium]
MRLPILSMLLAMAVASFANQAHCQDPVILPPVPVATDIEKIPPVASMEQVVVGEPNCCGHCSCQATCQKRTRIVCEMKKVKKKVFDCECEDICTVLPSSMLPDSLFGISLWGKKHVGCGEVGCSDCAQGCCTKAPVAGHCRTRKILVVKTVTEQVPVYKCVVEYCCDSCGRDIAAPEAANSAKIDPAADEVHHVARLPRDPGGYGE